MKTTRKHIDLQERIVFRTILFLIVSTILLLLPASVFAQEEEDTPSPASAVQDAGPLADPGEGTTLQSPASEAAVKASDSTEANGEDKPEMDDTAQTEVSNAAESSVSSPGPPDPDALSHYRFPKQPKLRPCCAFGHTLRTTVSGTAVPVKLDNILYPHRLGLHSYENKGLQQEMNGLIYTCRGGVIDLAHIRDYADWTAYLYERILQALPRGAVIQLPNEAATRSLVIRRPVLSLDDAETQELALLLARRIAFQLSVWHEIVTWYDHRSVELFSERLSSFSPEDLFSNALGTQIGAEALRSGKPYNEAVDEALTQAVQSLAPLYNKQTKRTLNMVDGVWWDRSKTMPDMTMVMRRNLDVGDTIVPWVLPDAFSPYCKGRGEEPARIAIPVVGPGELNLTDLYELRFVVDTEEVPKFIVPDKENGWIGEEDFPELIGTIRIEVKNLFGPLGDSPTISLEEGTGLSSKAGEFDPEHPCGLADKDCSLTRNEEVHGIHIGKVRVAGGSFPGMVFGATLAEGATIGGLFNVLTMNTAVDFTDGSFTLHAKAIESPVLFFCSVEAEDGSGRTEVGLSLRQSLRGEVRARCLLGLEAGPVGNDLPATVSTASGFVRWRRVLFSMPWETDFSRSFYAVICCFPWGFHRKSCW